MNIHNVISIVIKPFRKKRMKRFMQEFNLKPADKILDIGGTPFNWLLINHIGSVTLLNINSPENTSEIPQNLKFVTGDGKNLDYPDGSYSIVFSNSVIEHLHSYENQKKFASEIRRVGKKLWIQTPAKEFFIEPHYITPFIHYFPKYIQKKLLKNFSIWGLITRPSKGQVTSIVDEIRLLTYDEMKSLFPDCQIIKEKFLFFTKSYIAMRQ